MSGYLLVKVGSHGPLFGCIPCITIAIDSSRAEAVYRDIVAAYDEASMMILECYWVRVVAPVV